MTPSHPHFDVTQSFMRRIAPATFEIIARSGIRWHTAANKSVVIAVLRKYIIDNDIDGLAECYDSMRERSDKSEKQMVTKFLRSAQHAARQHREYVAWIIDRLFQPTNLEPQLVRVKEEIFGVNGGGPIIEPSHEAMRELLHNQPKGAQHSLCVHFSF
jgi:hypothetical protein